MSVKALILTVVFVVLAVWLVGISGTFQSCVYATQHQKTEQVVESFPNVARTLGAWSNCSGEFIHQNGETIVAVFTVILGIGTILLWSATKLLVEKSDEASQRQLRAYISVNPIRIYSAAIEERFNRVDFSLKNHGQTPANEIHHVFSVQVFPNPLPEGFTYPSAAVPVHSESALFPQGEMVVWFNFDCLLDTEQFNLLERDGLRLHIWGQTFYRTVFEQQAHTDFRASVGGPQFVANLRAVRRQLPPPEFQWTWESGHGSGN